MKHNIVLESLESDTIMNLMLAINNQKLKLHEAIAEAVKNKDELGQISLENQIADMNRVFVKIRECLVDE